MIPVIRKLARSLLVAAMLAAVMISSPPARAYIPREPVLHCIAVTAMRGHAGGFFCAETGAYYYPGRPAPAYPGP